MPAMPDLPPGARERAWILLGLTTCGGAAIYLVFGRAETLWIAGVALAILLYLLMGVELAMRQDRAELGPLVDAAIAAHGAEFWLVLDANGTLLRASDAGAAALGHPRDVIEGQPLRGLISEDPERRAAFGQLLRFGAIGQPWRGALEILDAAGKPHRHRLRTLPATTEAARRYGLIVLASDAQRD